MSSDNLVGPDSCPVYRRDAVWLGPFDGLPPLDLWSVLAQGHDGTTRFGDVVMRERARAWLTAALESNGVVLADYDHAVIGLLVDDCVTTVQVVAGWIAQGRGDGRPQVGPPHLVCRTGR